MAALRHLDRLLSFSAAARWFPILVAPQFLRIKTFLAGTWDFAASSFSPLDLP